MKPTEIASTVIGKSVHIRGELTGGEDLYMDGLIEGTIALTAHRLTIGPNARVLADISAQEVIVHGRVEGNIKAAARVELRQTSEVIGDIATARLSMEESALMKGRIEVVPPAAAGSKVEREVAAPIIAREDIVHEEEAAEAKAGATLFSAPTAH